MQQHGANPWVPVFLFYSFQTLPRLHDHNSNAVLHQLQVKCPTLLPERDSLPWEVIINAFFLIIKHCTKERRGDEGFLHITSHPEHHRSGGEKVKNSTIKNTVSQASISPATNHWFEARPGSWFQLENKRNGWIRVSFCFNDRSRLTVLDWRVKEAQHFLQKERGTIKFKLSDNPTINIDLRDFLCEDRLCTFSLGPA